MYTTVSQNSITRGFSAGSLYFCMTLLIDQVIVDLVVLKLIASCGNWCPDSFLVVGKLGLNIPLTSFNIMNRQYHPQHCKPNKRRMTCCLKDLKVLY